MHTHSDRIEDGTRAMVPATSEGILLMPVTAAMIERGFCLLKCRPGDRPLADAFAAPLTKKHKAELVTGDPMAREIRIH